jgi:hypothetical protein
MGQAGQHLQTKLAVVQQVVQMLASRASLWMLLRHHPPRAEQQTTAPRSQMALETA